MAPEIYDDPGAHELTIPRFDHGENLWVLTRPDGRFEFRTDVEGESVVSDNAVYLKDVT